MKKTLLVTGGAGFIGSNLVLKAVMDSPWRVINVDNLSYSGNLASLEPVAKSPDYIFVKENISNQEAISSIFEKYQPDAVMHLAAESHVDRSIDDPAPFMNTNIFGTFALLEASRKLWKKYQAQDKKKAEDFRFLHISTDEVFGDLSDNKKEAYFTEDTAYNPSSPYSASKASSDHLVRAWHRTYGLPALITNCSNNYGPRQFPEKLIPLTILNAIAGKPLPVYGAGAQIRDWLYVEDHVDALLLTLAKGQPGATYAIGGHNEKKNIEVVHTICDILDELKPRANQKDKSDQRSYCDLIQFVKDRPGHDGRYAIDASKISHELSWKPKHTFEEGIKNTVLWYLENQNWWQPILTGAYRGERLGLGV